MSDTRTADPDPQAAARALHAASFLGWLRWDQLPPDCRAEYAEAAQRGADFTITQDAQKRPFAGEARG